MNETIVDRAMESPTLGKLGEALAKAQGEMRPATKDAANPFFKSKYADLASIWEAIRAPLASNGLSIVQRVVQRVLPAQPGVHIETTLIHASGEWVRDSLYMPVKEQTPQAYGSALTYARRYSLAAMVGVSAEDDDGNAASRATEQNAKTVQNAQSDVLREKLQSKTGTGMSPAWSRMLALGETYGKTGAALNSVVKGVTNKTSPSQVTDDDVSLVESALMALHPPPAKVRKMKIETEVDGATK